MELDRAIRFSASGWRDGDRLNKDKIAAAIAVRPEDTIETDLAGGANGRGYVSVR